MSIRRRTTPVVATILLVLTALAASIRPRLSPLWHPREDFVIALAIAVFAAAVAWLVPSRRLASVVVVIAMLLVPVLACRDGSTVWNLACDAWLAVDLILVCAYVDWVVLAIGAAITASIWLQFLALPTAVSDETRSSDFVAFAIFLVTSILLCAVMAYLEGLFLANEHASTDARALADVVKNVANPLAVIESPALPVVPTRPRITYVNDAFTRLTGFSRGEADAAFDELHVTDDENRIVAPSDLLRPSTGRVRGRRGVGNGEFEFDFTSYEIESDPTVRRRVVMLSEIDASQADLRAARAERRAAELDAALAEREAATRTLWRAANFDALTGVPNRKLLEERLAAFVAQGRAGAILFIDCDRLKSVNDVFGHGVGDRLLILFAERVGAVLVGAALRSEDLLARLGGDEFVAIAYDADAAAAASLSRRITKALGEPFAIDGRTIRLSASIGTKVRAEGDTSDDLLRDADAAMRRAKSLGRGQSVGFSRPLRDRSNRRARLEHDLEAELGSGAPGIIVQYQPILELATGNVLAFEALVRWQHPQLGLLRPLDFVPIAEETGTIVELGNRVLETASLALRRFERAGLIGHSVMMNVNVSPRQLADPNYLLRFLQTLRETGLDPERLCLEITESVLVEEMGVAAPVLAALRAQGAKVALDDFGTGYSSLRYLHQLPVDELKVDRSFVSENEIDGLANSAIVRAIVGIARDAELSIVAEGVESANQARALAELGISRAQGYLFSRPLDIARTEEFLRSRGYGATA